MAYDEPRDECVDLTSCPTGDCGDGVFSRLMTDVLIEGGTRVTWEMAESFADPGPYAFQLQVSLHGVPTATDWVAVGATIYDKNYAIDDLKRVYGQSQFTHYRICLQTAHRTYFSRSIRAWEGGLSFRDSRLAREIMRQEKVNFREEGIEGYFLKRKLFGEPCRCLDFQTEEIRNAECDLCYGTGFAGGYWPGLGCVYTIMDPRARHEELDGGQARGTINDVRVNARMLAQPFMSEEDVWIDRRSDNRWFVHKIQHIAEKRGVPLVAQVELRHAPYSHKIYQFPRPDQSVV